MANTISTWFDRTQLGLTDGFVLAELAKRAGVSAPPREWGAQEISALRDLGVQATGFNPRASIVARAVVQAFDTYQAAPFPTRSREFIAGSARALPGTPGGTRLVYADIQVQELARHRSFYTIIDLRSEEEVMSHGVIPGAVNLPDGFDALETWMRGDGRRFDNVVLVNAHGEDVPEVIRQARIDDIMSRPFLLSGGMDAWNVYQFVEAMKRRAGWEEIESREVPRYRDIFGRIFEVSPTTDHGLLLNLQEGPTDRLSINFNLAEIRGALEPYDTITVMNHEGMLSLYDYDELAHFFHWTRTGEQNGYGPVFMDRQGRRFGFEIVGSNTLRLVQELPFDRAPEWIFAQDINPQAQDLLTHYPEFERIEIVTRSRETGIRGKYIPQPSVIERPGSYTQPAEVHLANVTNLLAPLGLRPVDGLLGERPEGGPGLPVFSLNDGDKRLVAYHSPHVEVGARRAVPVHVELPPDRTTPMHMAILVSNETHALEDLLENIDRGFLNATVTVVVSNNERPALRRLAESRGIHFEVIPVPTKEDGGQPKHREDLLAFLKQEKYRPELVVMAKYMQILSPEFIDEFGYENIINIHHGLLPAFQGNKPYHRAHERGVEQAGGTAHFATRVLDTGPPIAQEPEGFESSTATLGEIKDERGARSERRALTRAVQLWLRDRLVILNDREVMMLGAEHPQAKDAPPPRRELRYVGMVVDRQNVMTWLADRVHPGEVFLRQYGDAWDPSGPIKPQTLIDAFNTARAEARLPEDYLRDTVVRVMGSTDREYFLYRNTQGDLVVAESNPWFQPPSLVGADLGVGPGRTHGSAPTPQDEGIIFRFPIRETYTGLPGLAHGGMLAALIEEAYREMVTSGYVLPGDGNVQRDITFTSPPALGANAELVVEKGEDGWRFVLRTPGDSTAMQDRVVANYWRVGDGAELSDSSSLRGPMGRSNPGLIEPGSPRPFGARDDDTSLTWFSNTILHGNSDGGSLEATFHHNTQQNVMWTTIDPTFNGDRMPSLLVASHVGALAAIAGFGRLILAGRVQFETLGDIPPRERLYAVASIPDWKAENKKQELVVNFMDSDGNVYARARIICHPLTRAGNPISVSRLPASFVEAFPQGLQDLEEGSSEQQNMATFLREALGTESYAEMKNMGRDVAAEAKQGWSDLLVGLASRGTACRAPTGETIVTAMGAGAVGALLSRRDPVGTAPANRGAPRGAPTQDGQMGRDALIAGLVTLGYDADVLETLFTDDVDLAPFAVILSAAKDLIVSPGDPSGLYPQDDIEIILDTLLEENIPADFDRTRITGGSFSAMRQTRMGSVARI